MSLYQLGSRTSNVTTGAACWELRSGASRPLYVREVKVFMAAATASTFGLGRPAAIGVTPTSPVTVLPVNTDDATGTGQVALAWATGPTIPTNFFERFSLVNQIGAGIILAWPNLPLVVPVSSSVILWNISATGVSDVAVSLEE